jgi:hypothetical protein
MQLRAEQLSIMLTARQSPLHLSCKYICKLWMNLTGSMLPRFVFGVVFSSVCVFQQAALSSSACRWSGSPIFFIIVGVLIVLKGMITEPLGMLLIFVFGFHGE